MISGPQDVPNFARDLYVLSILPPCAPGQALIECSIFSAHQTEAMQKAILAELDSWTANNPEVESSSGSE